MTTKTLMLHAGGYTATRADVIAVATPPVDEQTGWTPIPHIELLDRTVGTLAEAGYQIEQEELGLWGKNGERFFGTFLVGDRLAGGQAQFAIGLANSHDKTITARIAAGSRVFVCDNRAFSGDITLSRMHTRHIWRDLPAKITEAVAALKQDHRTLAERYALYQATELAPKDVSHLLIGAYDAKVISGGKIDDVLGEWRRPQHPEFQPRTAWSLFNAFTEVLKEIQPIDLPRRTRALEVLLDGTLGFTPPARLEIGTHEAAATTAEDYAEAFRAAEQRD